MGDQRLVAFQYSEIDSKAAMTDLLCPEFLVVDGRTYRALYSPGRPVQQHQKHARNVEELGGEEEEWGASGTGGTGGWQEEAEEEPSVDIVQEGEGFVARLGLDSEVIRGGRDGIRMA